MADVAYALSIRQPWAALIVAGRKTIEVRTWSTQRRGPIWIHASKLPDPRPEAWAHVNTPDLMVAASRIGGLIGVADLIDCIVYPAMEPFARDCEFHSNAREWFQPPQMYGFRFDAARPVPFQPYVGKTLFFPLSIVPIAAVERPVPSPQTRIVVRPPEYEEPLP